MTSHHSENDAPGFIRRHAVLLILVGLGLASGGYLLVDHTPSKPSPKKKEMVMIVCPGPEPIKQQVKKEETPREEKKEEKDDKMIVQEEVKVEEPKAKDPAPDKPSDELLGTAIGGGDGSLGNSNGGSRMIGGNNDGGGSKWGWYAGQVQNRVADALRSNPVTKRAGFSNMVKIWSDSTGRITRVKLADSTGDGKVDAAIENEVFNGLVLNEPPPEGMPMPINLRLTAR
ncbi:MAG: TonB C-terminal domain-containing protein [Verrucomicrobia bacterium]|nr:TonB C-terminal domain-containing protein [Verrucomicrobiota bacterium]